MLNATFNTDVTIYNMWYNPETRIGEWYPTHLRGVSFYGGQMASVGESGMSAADEYTLRIPESSMSDGFLPPIEYAQSSDPENHWTVRTGDVIVPELVEGQVAQITDITSKYDQAVTITGWYDNRRGVKMLWHIRVKGK